MTLSSFPPAPSVAVRGVPLLFLPMLSRTFRTLLATTGAAALAGVSGSRASEALSFNLTNSGLTAMSATASAGAPTARFASWNGFSGASLTRATDSHGRTLAVTASMSSGSYGGSAGTDGDPRMMGTYFDQTGGSASTFTVSNIPYATYDVYVYVYGDEGSANANNRGGKVTVGGTSYSLRTGTATRVTSTDGTGYLLATESGTTPSMTTPLANYARFTGLTGSSVSVAALANVLSGGDSTPRLKVAGIQIVNTGSDIAAPAAAPAASVLSDALPNNNSVLLVWSKAVDATGYSIQRATAAAGPYAEIATVATITSKYNDATAVNGTTYYYKVVATNSAGSTDSNVLSATPSDGSALNAIGVQFRGGGTAIAAATLAGAPGVRTANWNSFLLTGTSLGTLVDNKGATVSGASLTFSPGNANYGNAGSQTTNDVALFSGHHDKFDGSNASVTVAGIPYARYDVYFYVKDDTVDRAGSVTIGSTTYYVSGPFGGNIGQPASDGSGYILSSDTSASFVSGSTTVYDYTTVDKGNYVKFTGLTGGTFTATYTAIATSAAARRLKVAGFQIVDTTPAGSAPATPSGLTASTGNGQVALSWNSVSAATTYTIKRSSTYAGAYTALATQAATTFNDTTAVNGQVYYYVVSANNSGGGSPDSTPVSGSPRAFTPVSLSIDLKSSAATAMVPADVAGAPGVSTANWNSLVVPASTGATNSVTQLVDSGGAAVTGATISYTPGTATFGTAGSNGSATGNSGSLFYSYADQYDGVPATLTATGIPYATYDLYVYARNDGSDRAGSVTVNGVTYYVRGGINNPDSTAAYIGSTDTENLVTGAGADIDQGHYIRIPNLSGDLNASLVAVSAGSGAQRFKIAGFQIVNAAAPTAPSAVPAAPGSVTATPGVAQNIITWTPSNTATGYTIRRATVAGGPYTDIATVSAFVTSYTDTGLSHGATYYYTVVANNSVGSSAASTETSGTTQAPAPANLSATAGDTQVVLNWTAAPTATGYEIRMRTATGAYPAEATATVTGTTYTSTGLTNGDAYYYVVRSLSPTGSSLDTAEVLAVPVVPGVNRSIGLNFTDAAGGAVATDASGAPGVRQGNWNNYQILTPPASPGSTTLGPVAGGTVDNTGVTIDGFSTEFTSNSGGSFFRSQSPAGNDRIYRSVFDQTNGAASQIILHGIPYAKYDVYVYVYDDRDQRAGTVTVNDGGSVKTYYIRGLSSATTGAEGALNPASDGTGYVLADQTVASAGSSAAQGNYIRIVGMTVSDMALDFQAIAAGDAAQRIKIVGVQIVNTSGSTSLPSAATNLVATAGDGQVGLSWTAAPGVSSYNIARSLVAGGPYATIATGVSGTTYTDTSVTNGTAYHYVVVSVSSAAGTQSAEAAATPNVPAPAAPLNLVATAGDTVVDLSWSASAGATSYTIRSSTTSGGPYTDLSAGVVTGTTYQATGLANGTLYYFVVAAVGAGGTGANSSQASATPVAASPLIAWRQANFGTPDNTGSAADTADPDADGRPNLLEYATGTNPKAADAGPAVVIGQSGGHLTLTYTRIADPALIYTVQGSSDLAAWATVSTGNNPSTGVSNTAGSVTVTDTATLGAQPRRFLRLQITSN